MESSLIVLLVLAAVGVVVLGLLVLSVVLLIGERTRVAGIVLLVLILLGVPLVGVVLAAIVYVRVAPQPAPVPRAPVRQLREPVEFVPVMPEAPEAVPTDEPTAAEDADRPGQTEQPSTADEPDPDTAATHRTSSPMSGSVSTTARMKRIPGRSISGPMGCSRSVATSTSRSSTKDSRR